MSVHLRVSIVGTVLRVSWSSRHHSLGRYVFTSLLVVTSLRVSQFERCHVSHSRNVITCLTVGTLLSVYSRYIITSLTVGTSSRFLYSAGHTTLVGTSLRVPLVGTSSRVHQLVRLTSSLVDTSSRVLQKVHQSLRFLVPLRSSPIVDTFITSPIVSTFITKSIVGTFITIPIVGTFITMVIRVHSL